MDLVLVKLCVKNFRKAEREGVLVCRFAGGMSQGLTQHLAPGRDTQQLFIERTDDSYLKRTQ